MRRTYIRLRIQDSRRFRQVWGLPFFLVGSFLFLFFLTEASKSDSSVSESKGIAVEVDRLAVDVDGIGADFEERVIEGKWACPSARRDL